MSNPRSPIHDRRSPTRSIPFTKMVGAGNDFLIVDTIHQRFGSLKAQWPAVARAMCDRRYGIGADGLLILEASRKADCRMRIFNSDGSEAEMCGNGARCVASYLKSAWAEGRRQKAEGRTDRVTIETKAGLVPAEIHGNQVSMWMPDPKIVDLKRKVQINGTVYSLCVLGTGVPHAVLFVEDLKNVDVHGLGREIRYHRAFQPDGTNVDFVNVINKSSIAVRTYERGVEGETLACGTGVTAAAVIHALTRSNGHHAANKAGAHRIAVQTRSGETLTVSLRTASRPTPQVSDVVLEGAVRWICQGRFAGRI